MINQKITTMMDATIATTPSARMSIPTARPTSPEHLHAGTTCSVVISDSNVVVTGTQYNVIIIVLIMITINKGACPKSLWKN